MKLLLLLVAMLCAPHDGRADEVFGTISPGTAKLFLAKGSGAEPAKEIDSVDIAQFSHFEIQRDAAALFTRMGTVRVYDHQGKSLIPETQAIKVKISSTVIAAINPGKMVIVFNRKTGKQIYVSPYPATVGVSDQGFTVRNQWNQRWETYNAEGKKLSDNWITPTGKMWMNESGIAILEDHLLRLWDIQGNLISTYTQVSDVSVNETLVAFQQLPNQLTFANFSDENHIYLQANLIAMIPNGYLLNQQSQNFIYDNQGQMVEALFNRTLAGMSNHYLLFKPYASLGFELYDRKARQFSFHPMSLGMSLSDTAVASKTGIRQFEILSSHPSRIQHLEMDPNLADYGISDTLYFKRSVNGALRNGVVKRIHDQSTVFDETFVDSISLANPSLRRNWQNF